MATSRPPSTSRRVHAVAERRASGARHDARRCRTPTPTSSPRRSARAESTRTTTWAGRSTPPSAVVERQVSHPGRGRWPYLRRRAARSSRSQPESHAPIVSWPRTSPFQVTARVRIPLGVPRQFFQVTPDPGPVVKLQFTPACQAGGRGFESRRDRQSAGAYRHPSTRSSSSVGRAPPAEKRKVTKSDCRF